MDRILTKTKSKLGGFGYFTKEDINPGRLLLEEDCKLFVALNNNLTFQCGSTILGFCANCLSFDALSEVILCPKATCLSEEIRLCSIGCREKHEKIHPALCISPIAGEITTELELAFKISILSSAPFNYSLPEHLKINRLEIEIENRTNSKNNSTDEILSLIGEERDNFTLIAKKISEIKHSPIEKTEAELNSLLVAIYKSAFSMRPPVFDEVPFALGVFDKASFFNHSCEPNCHVVFVGRRIKVHSLREIKAGEELVISYAKFSEDNSARQRKDFLLSCFGFECNCESCMKELEINENFVNTFEDAKILDSAEDNFEKGNFVESWTDYFTFYTKNSNLPNKLEIFSNNLLSLEKMLSISIFTKEYEKGLLVTEEILKSLELINNKHKNKSIKDLEQKMESVTLTSFSKNRSESNDIIISDFNKYRPKNEKYSLLKLKTLIMEMFFNLVEINSGKGFYYKESSIFNTARKVEELGCFLYGDSFPGICSELRKMHKGFACVIRVLESVEGYFGSTQN